MYVNKMLSHTGSSFKDQKTNVINPQFVTVLNKGWLKVISAKGTGWINLAEKFKIAYITFDDGPSEYTNTGYLEK
ncbi:hypothetical protein [Metabacillus sp. RGM 3146]|uniref:hypothetical protein n=1 Tax=Metabacillus sp. RGM 3146 TaxID=3401092 RepID=UPI003B99A00F